MCGLVLEVQQVPLHDNFIQVCPPLHQHIIPPFHCLQMLLEPLGPAVPTCTSSPHSGQHATVEISYLGPLFFSKML